MAKARCRETPPTEGVAECRCRPPQMEADFAPHRMKMMVAFGSELAKF